MTSLIILIISTLSGVLGGMGLISPYMGGLAALSLGLGLKLNLVNLLTIVISSYMSVMIATSLLNVKGLSTSVTAVDEIREEKEIEEREVIREARKLGLIKIVGVCIALILPAFKLPVITGWGVLFLAIAILWFSNQLSLEEGKRLSITVIVQTLIWIIALSIVLYLKPHCFTTLSIIAGSSIPSLLLKSPESRLSSPNDLMKLQEDEEFEHDSRLTHPFRPLWLMGIISLILLFPGYSSGSLIGSFTPNDSLRKVYVSFVEAFIEGWVLKLFISGMSSSKSPLGDILSASPFNLNLSLSLPSPLYILALTGICVITIISVMPYIERVIGGEKLSKNFIIFSLALQAFATAGPLSIILIGAGFISYYSKLLIPDSLSLNSSSLSLLTPMLLP